MVKIVNISGTESYIDAKPNFFFLKRERKRDFLSFLTSRYYDEFFTIYAVFRATIFSFHFAPLLKTIATIALSLVRRQS